MTSVLFFLLSIFFSLSLTDGTQLIIVNNCKESIWPGIFGSAGHPSPADGGFHLGSNEQVVLEVPEKWSGRLWGRQGCCFDQNGKEDVLLVTVLANYTARVLVASLRHQWSK
ncbi:hypothetical protein C5167_003137 [Papaver somniferum]|uniref:Uncharacterized protein n=1 Tax=Papaver somniferum TaxID=3469 RepID=A0A4Y7L3V0_PAPSO|nr:hypothetical protein C5167_003137 [Papaver somniferum]